MFQLEMQRPELRAGAIKSQPDHFSSICPASPNRSVQHAHGGIG